MGVGHLTLTRLGEPDGDRSSASASVVRRAKAGDREAFEALVIEHERRVLRTALRLLGRMDLAQDAAQEVFLRLHKYLARFDDERELAPWLYQMLVNVCHDVRRRSFPGGTVALDDVAEPVDEGAARAVEAGLEREQRRMLVARALESLPPKERAVVVLRDIEGRSTREVADIVGSTEATVRSHLCSGRVRVKKIVEKLMRRRP
jgi:RNA polymerase sigma-70 factor (ECF subfamily)